MIVQLEDTNDFIWDEFALITEEGLSYRSSLCGFFFASLVYVIGKHPSPQADLRSPYLCNTTKGQKCLALLDFWEWRC